FCFSPQMVGYRGARAGDTDALQKFAPAWIVIIPIFTRLGHCFSPAVVFYICRNKLSQVSESDVSKHASQQTFRGDCVSRHAFQRRSVFGSAGASPKSDSLTAI